MSTSKNVIFVGGPSSGKSNYLFRTWLAIERNDGLLKKNGLPEDLEYLHDGSSILLGGKFAPHTSKDTHNVCEIPTIQRTFPYSESVLTVPDASGELWLDLYGKREWPLAWDELITDGCGFILFICVGSPHNILALDWVTCERIYGSGTLQQPTDVPTQVMLVDWLQILRSIVDRKLSRAYRPRLSVVVTAWDRATAAQQQTGPSDYLETEFPLFAQFIRAGWHGFDAKVFGLSIFGGDLEKDFKFREEFLRGEPSKLGFVVSEVRSGFELRDDVLIPIYWALGIEP